MLVNGGNEDALSFFSPHHAHSLRDLDTAEGTDQFERIFKVMYQFHPSETQRKHSCLISPHLCINHSCKSSHVFVSLFQTLQTHSISTAINQLVSLLFIGWMIQRIVVSEDEHGFSDLPSRYSYCSSLCQQDNTHCPQTQVSRTLAMANLPR